MYRYNHLLFRLLVLVAGPAMAWDVQAAESSPPAEDEATDDSSKTPKPRFGAGERYNPFIPSLPADVIPPGDPRVPPDDTLDEITRFDPFDFGKRGIASSWPIWGTELADVDARIREEPAAMAEDGAYDIETRTSAQQDMAQAARFTPFGTEVSAAGGVQNFTQSGLQDITGAAGFWDLRVAAGTRSIIGVEAAYRGSAQDIAAIGIDQEAFLVSNGLEGNLRVNAPLTFSAQDVSVLLEPFALAGVGFARYNLFNEGVNTSDIDDQDDIVTVPVGVGLAAGLGGVMLDGRFTYRQAFGSGLLGSPTGAFGADALNTWSLGAGLGFEF